jgi:hypothetical protein
LICKMELGVAGLNDFQKLLWLWSINCSLSHSTDVEGKFFPEDSWAGRCVNTTGDQLWYKLFSYIICVTEPYFLNEHWDRHSFFRTAMLYCGSWKFHSSLVQICVQYDEPLSLTFRE